LIDTTTPITMFSPAIPFGLSMDYEVFLLSSIKEKHGGTTDNTESVALGLELPSAMLPHGDGFRA
jgi:putative drug exporter of the RND superfamily